MLFVRKVLSQKRAGANPGPERGAVATDFVSQCSEEPLDYPAARESTFTLLITHAVHVLLLCDPWLLSGTFSYDSTMHVITGEFMQYEKYL